MIERLIDGSAALWPAIATHLWQSTLVLLILAWVARALHGASARLMCLFWSVALLKLFLPLHWVGRLGEAAAEPVAVRTWIYPQVLQVTATGEQAVGTWLYPALSAAWLCGVALLLLRGQRQPLLPATPSPGDLLKLEAAISQTSIPRSSVRVCARPEMPHVRGWWQPRIYVSRSAIEGLSADDLRAVLLHEEAHRLRRDPLRLTALRLAGAMWFFYPPVWWLIRRIRETTEMACDEAALNAGLSADDYAGSLARTLRLGLAQSSPATAIHGRRSSLKHRFARLNENRRYVTMNRHRFALAAAVMLVGLASFSPIIPAVEGPTSPARAEDGDKPLLPGQDGVTQPVAIEEFRVMPVYPESMRAEAITGKVILQAVIDKAGRVGELEVLRSRPEEREDMIASAMDAVVQWRYEPATLDGEPVAVYFTIVIDFNLDDSGNLLDS